MRHQYLAPLIALGLVACQATTPSRPPVTTGGDDSSVPVGTATKKPVQATPTPVASATPTAGPLTADVSSPWSLSSSATASTTVGSAGGATAGGSAGAQLPRKVARHGLSYSDGVLLVAGGLLEPPSPGVGGAIISDFATASVTASGSLSTIGAWATSSLPIRICDQGLTVDHKKRFVLIGGVTQSDAGQNSAVKSVYVGTMAAGSKVLNWVKTDDLPFVVSAFALATSTTGKTHYLAGGLPPSKKVLVGTSADDGKVTWAESSNSLPTPIQGAASVIVGTKLYVIGGTGDDENQGKKVYSAAINSDGTLGVFSEAATLPAVKTSMKAYVDAKGQIVVVGGNGTKDTESGTTSTVFIGKFDSGGALAFSAGPAFPLPIQHYGLALTGIDAIIAGGSHVGEVSQYSHKVYQLPLNY